MARGALLLAIACVACSEQGEAEAPARTGRGTPAPDPPPARFAEIEGAVTHGGAAARRGADVEAEQPIDVPAGARVALLLRDGARIALDGEARARVVEESASQVLLLVGAAHVVQPPSDSAPRPPLRVTTPAATVEVAGAGAAYVAHLEGGSSWIAVLSGVASVSNGDADARRRLRTVDLGAAQSVSVPQRIGEASEGPSTIADARAQLRALPIVSEPEVDRLVRDVANESERLDQALRWLETETRRGRELTSQHRAAVRAGRSDEAHGLQNTLAEHSQTLYRLRQLATARWERLRAQWLRLAMITPAPPATDPVAQRRERVVGLLGL